MQITEARFRGGDVGELDMIQARTQLLGTQATIPPLETGLQQARNALSILLGQPPGSLRRLAGPDAGRDSGGASQRLPRARRRSCCAGARTCARRNSPRRRKVRRSGVAEADLYPSFGLSGFLGVVAADGTNTTRSGNSGIGQLFNANSLTFIGGPYFSWNILNYGRIRNNVRVQDARLQQLLENYQGTVLNAVKEVEDDMVAFLRSREQERILAETEAAAQRSLKIANVGYREGFSDFQRVLDAQGSLAAGAAVLRDGAQHHRQQRDRDLSGAGRRLGDPLGPRLRRRGDRRTRCKSARTGAISCKPAGHRAAVQGRKAAAGRRRTGKQPSIRTVGCLMTEQQQSPRRAAERGSPRQRRQPPPAPPRRAHGPGAQVGADLRCVLPVPACLVHGRRPLHAVHHAGARQRLRRADRAAGGGRDCSRSMCAPTRW